ncbi:hypothetical protein BKA70DRAFT_1396353 [Coprinopsis sp. MPI-PUGE-AT-0042]|nr:hypothetical protein BKA70DRAFT_1396353 [Coprinopsis sp. MPI-PUGE-AT-0042]
MDSMLKRKRPAYEDDSDDEIASYGRQILPVANLPSNFDGEPEDGMQYLFTVRRDAMKLPDITRVANPYETKPLPEVIDASGSSHPSLPCEEWCKVLETRFQNLRRNFEQPTIFVGQAHDTRRRYMPEKKERDLWWAYLEGKPESDWNITRNSKKQNRKRQQQQQQPENTMRAWADEPESGVGAETIVCESSLINDEGEVEQALSLDPAEGLPTPTGTPGPSEPSIHQKGIGAGKARAYTPREPTPVVLKLIDEPTALHLLMYFTHWLNCHLQHSDSVSYLPRESHARWIFSLLSRIDDHISADDMSLLRNLARACLGLLDHLIARRILPRVGASSSQDLDLMTERSCWIILSLIVNVWKQRDLWMDAANILTKYPMPATAAS